MHAHVVGSSGGVFCFYRKGAVYVCILAPGPSLNERAVHRSRRGQDDVEHSRVQVGTCRLAFVCVAKQAIERTHAPTHARGRWLLRHWLVTRLWRLLAAIGCVANQISGAERRCSCPTLEAVIEEPGILYQTGGGLRATILSPHDPVAKRAREPSLPTRVPLSEPVMRSVSAALVVERAEEPVHVWVAHGGFLGLVHAHRIAHNVALHEAQLWIHSGRKYGTGSASSRYPFLGWMEPRRG